MSEETKRVDRNKRVINTRYTGTSNKMFFSEL